jgi:hypothetical protein
VSEESRTFFAPRAETPAANRGRQYPDEAAGDTTRGGLHGLHRQDAWEAFEELLSEEAEGTGDRPFADALWTDAAVALMAAGARGGVSQVRGSTQLVTHTAMKKVANRDIRVWHGATENGP